ncbi:MAG: hypothetical protein AAFO82_04225 [Bacteroidota bacterium]
MKMMVALFLLLSLNILEERCSREDCQCNTRISLEDEDIYFYIQPSGCHDKISIKLDDDFFCDIKISNCNLIHVKKYKKGSLIQESSYQIIDTILRDTLTLHDPITFEPTTKIVSYTKAIKFPAGG